MPGTPDEHAGPSLRACVAGFAAAAALILVAAPFFAGAAKEVAEVSGLGLTFVGTLLVGLSTSLPELVSSVAAVRLKSYDLAVGNLIGSCAFNMIVFFALDVASPGGPFFARIAQTHALSALVSIVLLALALAAIVFRKERRIPLLEPDSRLMLVAYALGVWVIYSRSTR